MSYATASDVAALNKARVIGAQGQPTLTDVETYISMAAAEIDALLVNKGYEVPVGSQYPSAWGLLNAINAQGALAKMEEAAQSSRILDSAKAAYTASMQMLSAAQQVMDAPKDTERAEPRGPWLTSLPTGQVYNPQNGLRDDSCNSPADPYFSRSQRF